MAEITRKILFHPSDSVHSAMFAGESTLSSLENELRAPWYYLRKRLEEAGYQVETSYEANFNIDNVHRVIFFNIPDELRSPAHRLIYGLKRLRDKIKNKAPRPYFYKKILDAGLKDKMAIMLWEPSAVISENENERLHKMFPKVFTWNENYHGKSSIYKPIHWPQPIKTPALAEAMPFTQRKLLVNFSGNKSSKHPRELYTARKEVIQFMGGNFPDSFDHYGPGWQGYPHWKGIVDSKFDVYPHYKFGLCYENLLDEPGYITEKIFDCLRGNCVPIYWGDPNIEKCIPANSFIDRRKYSSTKELVDALLAMDEEEWKEKIEAGQKYLQSQAFEKFLPEQFTKLFFDGLDL